MSLTLERFEPTPAQVEAARTPEERAEERRHAIREKLAARAFRFADQPPKPVAALKLDGKPVSTPGNLTNIQAGVKAGKTAVVGAILGAFIRGNYQGGECLGFDATNPDGRAVLHIDSEQSRFDADALVRRSLKRAGLPEPPPWLYSYALADMDTAERREAMREAVKLAADECGGVQAVIVDGVADLCLDPNDPAESFALVAELHSLAIAEDCPVVTVLHENPGSETGKTRGHLGSQLERKAETNLRLVKDGDGITTIYTERARHCHIPKAEGVCFQWSDEARMHVSCGSAGAIQAEAKRRKMRDEAERVIEGDSMSYTELTAAIMDALDLKERAAKGRVTAWRAEGVIAKGEDGRIRLNDQ